MGQLNAKTALVTGATSGIGLAAARRFADEGAHVFVTGRRQGQLDEAVASIGSAATGIRSDVTDPADLDRVFEAIMDHGRRRGVRPARRDLPRALRRHLRPQRRRHPVYGAEGAPRAELGRLAHSVGLYVRQQRHPGVQRLRRLQGRHPLLRPHLGRGASRPGDPREHPHPR